MINLDHRGELAVYGPQSIGTYGKGFGHGSNEIYLQTRRCENAS